MLYGQRLGGMACSLIDADNMAAKTRPSHTAFFFRLKGGQTMLATPQSFRKQISEPRHSCSAHRPATPRWFRKQSLSALVGMIALAGMTPHAPAQCQLQKLLASDGATNDLFGASVAISGETAVIGARWGDGLEFDSGSAYVFEKVGGVWMQTAKLNASDGVTNDQFGLSAAISGDTAVIGAWSDDDFGNDSGAAYVFERVAGVWTQTAKLTDADGAEGDGFGWSVALSGETMVIGALWDDDLSINSGSAFVFEKLAGVWTQTGKLNEPGGGEFGDSVAVSADRIVIGSRFDDRQGAAYVYERVVGVWMQVAKLTASDGDFSDLFGNSVAVSGDTAVIGAWFDDDLGSTSGSAYVFERVAGIWTQTAKLNADDGAAGDAFGRAVALSGATAVIGSSGDDLGIDSGSAYVFEKVGGAWTQTAKLNADDGAAGDGFGGSISVSGATALIAAPSDDDQGGGSGSAYVFLLAGSDSDGDGVIDDCDNCALPNPAQEDCDHNGIGDVCDLADCPGDPPCSDCNANDIPDVCDISSGTSTDCNANGIPDECDSDSDGDGVIDDCDNCALPNPAQEDCNNNGIGDACDIADCPGDPPCSDCNTNGIPDVCDISSGTSTDCNGNGIPDDCDTDSDGDGVIDDCDNCGLPNPAQEDCNNNGIGDACDIADCPGDPPCSDCNINSIPDGCETDDDGDGVIDDCDNCTLPNPAQEDCNNNGIGDACEIADCPGDPSCSDCNANGIPDECETDTDADGVIDDCDPCPLDNPDDTDGDSVCDADDLCSETSFGLLVDLDGCTRTEGPCCFPGAVCIDGTDRQTCEAFPDSFFQGEGLTCGDPDGDGIFGCSDGCPLDPAKANPGVCGCGIPDDDGDLDGIADCNDHCSQTPSDVPVNVCGCAEVGACCASAGGCFDDIERTLCVMIAGVYQGDGSTCAENCALGDLDDDGDVDLADFALFTRCFTGVGGEASPACSQADVDGCGQIDLEDFVAFRAAFTGP